MIAMMIDYIGNDNILGMVDAATWQFSWPLSLLQSKG